jgi:hypothetical protein
MKRQFRVKRLKRMERLIIAAFHRVGCERLNGRGVNLVQVKLWQIGIEIAKAGGGGWKGLGN